MIFSDFYPKTEVEFDAMFKDEESCHEYLFKMRWPNGYECPRCFNKKYWKNNRNDYQCSSCNYQMSITAGTILQGTTKPLRLWFKAMWWFTVNKTGISAKELHRLLGISYPTAWSWLHKLRLATIRPNREKLSGNVEVDETYIGGKEEQHQGRGSQTKVKVVIGVEIEEKSLGRTRMQVIDDCTKKSLGEFVQENVHNESEYVTDGWRGYNSEYNIPTHKVKKISESNLDASTLFPGVHRVSSLLKRMILGIYQGSFHKKYAQGYLDEFTFRFNRRKSRDIGLKFMRIVEQVVSTEHRTIANIVEYGFVTT